MRPLAPHRRRAPRGLRFTGALLALVLLAPPAGASVWPPYGVSLGPDTYGFFGARVFANSDGGATVAYFARYGGTQTYALALFAQVAADGSVLSAGPNDGSLTDFIGDGGTGMFLGEDFSQVDVARWPATAGWPVSIAQSHSPFLGVRSALTSAGGCLVAWASDQVYASIARADATVDPGWPANGLALGVPYFVNDPVRVAGDDAGGGFVTWWGSNGTANVELRLVRVAPDGTLAAGWPDGGILLQQGPLNDADGPPRLMRLPGGDALVMWKIGSGLFAPGAFKLARVRPDGTIAPGWPATGRIVRNAPDTTGVPTLLPDAADGAFLVWATRSGGSDVRAMHVLGNGSLAPGWTSAGLVLTAPAAQYAADWGSESGFSSFPTAYNFRAAPDGSGGLFAGWSDARGAAGSSVWITHWTGGGIPGDGWTVDGREVSDPSLLSHLGGIAPAPGGSAYVAWSALVNPLYPGYYHAWLERVDPEAPVPALVSLVSAAALDGRVRVEWSLGGGSAGATVYRSVAGASWTRVATLAPDGTGRIAYEDAAVVPGTRYGYRLGITEGGAETFAGEAWVEVPRLALALEGARPNPSPGGGLAAAFTLADGSPARLEALDLAGRRVAMAEVGALGAGRHVVTLARAVPPGIYLLRLTQAGREIDRRAAVLP